MVSRAARRPPGQSRVSDSGIVTMRSGTASSWSAIPMSAAFVELYEHPKK